MANVFLMDTPRDTKTALILEQANVLNIGNSVAYVDGTGQVFVNTDDNLSKLLPAYDKNVLKWILWHEKFHDLLGHHKRYFKYLKQLEKTGEAESYTVTKEEVNIIMDILIHDKLAKEFPEIEPFARLNTFQFRDSNSLGYTFKEKTLEKMLDEYREYKTSQTTGTSEQEVPEGEPGQSSEDQDSEDKSAKKKAKPSDTEEEGKPTQGSTEPQDENSDGTEEEDTEETSAPNRHNEVDWSQLENRDSKEFITDEESRECREAIRTLKNKRIKLAQLTETLNSLVSTTRQRTYRIPSTIRVSDKVIMKGRLPGKAKLHLCFDASGSMGTEMKTFKKIITDSIPQALSVPCSWFSGQPVERTVKPYKYVGSQGYYKGTFKDFLPVYPLSGFSDDGDRTIALCWEAEQQGYSPIGITDGGGRLSWSKDKLKQLKRTIIVCPAKYWIEMIKEVNPTIEVIYVERGLFYDV